MTPICWDVTTGLTTNYEKSRGYFQKAIDLQPDYAAAWGGLADSYLMPAEEFNSPASAVMPQAEAAAKKALELDDRAAEAHNSMAMIQLFYRWNWAAAERESARAVELNPSLAEGHFVRSYVASSLESPGRGIAGGKEGDGVGSVIRTGSGGLCAYSDAAVRRGAERGSRTK